MADEVPYPFTYMDVKGWLVERLKTLLHAAGYMEQSEIRVLKSDPHDAADIPCIGINLANADENSASMGDIAGTEIDPALNGGLGGVVNFYGTFMAETLELRVWEKNANERDKLRIYLTAQLFGLRRELRAFGITNIRISGGRDEQDNQTLQPTPLYFAPFNITYLNPLDVWETDQLISAITVEPIITVLGEQTTRVSAELSGAGKLNATP